MGKGGEPSGSIAAWLGIGIHLRRFVQQDTYLILEKDGEEQGHCYGKHFRKGRAPAYGSHLAYFCFVHSMALEGIFFYVLHIWHLAFGG